MPILLLGPANLARYNAMTHPVPFMKVSNVLAPKASAKGKDVPDLEEAIEEDEDVNGVEGPEAEDDDDEIDFKKDRYIKQPRKKPTKKAAKAKNDDDDDGPKKGRPKTKAKGKK